MKLKKLFKHFLHLFRGRIGHINPKDQTLVGTGKTQGLQFQVMTNRTAFTEDKRLNHLSIIPRFCLLVQSF